MNPQSRRKQAGLSLIELMVAVAILAILALVAYPTYTAQVEKSRRAVAKEALLEIAQGLERCYTQFLAYNDAGCQLLFNGQNVALPFTAPRTGTAYYTISATTLTASAFTLQAVPVAGTSQANDTACAAFTVNNLGARAATDSGGAANPVCW